MIIRSEKKIVPRAIGLVVWFLFWVQEVPGSIPGSPLFIFVLFIQLFNNATFSLIYSAILAILTYHFLGLYSFKNCKNAKNILSKHLILERFKSKMSHDENFWLNLAFMSTEQFGHLQWYRQAQFILFIKPVNFQQNTLCFEILSFQKGLQC